VPVLRQSMEQEYERLKAPTLRAVGARLRARGRGLRAEDLEPFYNDAWLALRNADPPEDRLAAFLTLVAYRRALDHLRRAPERRHEPLEAGALRTVGGEVAESLDDRRRLRELFDALADELTARERAAVLLCYVRGYRRADAARAMGLTERRFKKVMDAASRQVRVIADEIDAGTRCGRYASRNTAYALGLLDPGGHRYASTRQHLCACPACRADVRRIAQEATVA
jgi:RNA polymerase sigma factor (sigma-70 family)